MDWTRDLVQAVVDLAVSDVPPRREEVGPDPRHLLRPPRAAGHAGGAGPELPADPASNTPPLYDFLTQIAAFDSPIASFLDEEMRTFKNFPMTCQIAPVGGAVPEVRLEHAAQVPGVVQGPAVRLHRQAGHRRQLPSGTPADPGSPVRCPLEYAYAAWGQLPTPEPGKGDEFADFRAVTKDLLTAFQVRRLEALEHVANSVHGNPNTQKTPFVLPDLAQLRGQGRRPGPRPARVRHHRADGRAERLEDDPARPAGAPGADGRLPAGAVLRGRPGTGRGRAEPGERTTPAEA